MSATAVLDVRVDERVTFSDSQRTLHEWAVTTGRYRAVIPECPCGLIETLGVVYADAKHQTVARVHTAPKTNCLCRSEACRTNYAQARRKRLCHGWHRPRVDRLANDLAKPGKYRPRPSGAPMSWYRERDLVWTTS